MATIENVILNDDLDSRIQSGVETVTFYDPTTGQKREIELGEANRKHLANHLEKLQKYIDASRVVEAPPAKAVKAQKGNQAKIREWAQASGYTVGDRGRIKADIVEAYYAAQNVNENVRPEVEPEAVSVPVDEASQTAAELATQAEEKRQENGTPVTEFELQEMLLQMAVNGDEPTIDDLRSAE